MKISIVTQAPNEELADALGAFERQFRYPLGDESEFSISHGRDYARFFRAIGEAACFVAVDRDEVLGAVGCSLTRLRTPSNEEVLAVYFGDIKVSPGARSSRTLYRLFKATHSWVHGRTTIGFGVVMDNTTVLPGRYTGRLGFPRFEVSGKIALFHIDTHQQSDRRSRLEARSSNPVVTGNNDRRIQNRSSFELLGTEPRTRSRMHPVQLHSEDGFARGLLEDTRAAKQLIDENGVEIVSGHLSFFDYRSLDAAVALIKQACERCRDMAYPKLFVSVPSDCAKNLRSALDGFSFRTATATVYATGIETRAPWRINSSEI